MRLVVTSDLHYNVPRSKQPAVALAEEICGLRADALLLLGDVAGRDLRILREALQLFETFEGRKYFVSGNHELWTLAGESSLERLERTIPDICRELGFHPLDDAPAAIDGVGLVGSIGWYDYSFRPAYLNIPLRFYREKVAPGAASRLSGYEHLQVEKTDVPAESLRMGTRWMDSQHVNLPMSDFVFCHYLRDRLARHLDRMAGQCDRIVVGLHHVPFRKMVPPQENPSWAFAGAFLGSELFGELFMDYPQIRYVFCGHSHRRGHLRHAHLECINVGCTYVAKRYEIIEL